MVKYPYALVFPGGVITSPIASESDAIEDAALWLGERSKPQQLFQVNAFIDAVTLALGDIISIIHPRYGFANGRLAKIAAFQWHPARRRCTLTVIAEHQEAEDLFTADFGEEFA